MGAIALLESQKKAKQVETDEAKRKRAVLLTALARDNIEKDSAKAKTAAMEAHRLAPEFAPAAVAAAQACFRLNELRRGVHILEATWRKAPHPEIALAHVNARPGDSSLDRYKRAQRLQKLKPNNTDSSLILAQMALEAGEYEDARKAIALVLRNEPREGAFMLMADIEDADTGDQGKVREWLARAVRAPRDPAWTADGYVSEEWAPVSPDQWPARRLRMEGAGGTPRPRCRERPRPDGARHPRRAADGSTRSSGGRRNRRDRG
jgi:HemY protein